MTSGFAQESNAPYGGGGGVRTGVRQEYCIGWPTICKGTMDSLEWL